MQCFTELAVRFLGVYCVYALGSFVIAFAVLCSFGFPPSATL